MKKSVISTLLVELERLVQVEQESGVEFWLARDLQGVLGYLRWENFRKVIGDAMKACETSGNKASDQFLEVTKLIELSKGDQALFGGHTTQDMKTRLGVPDNRPLADFLLQKISKRLNAA
jgi:hypothetical protein